LGLVDKFLSNLGYHKLPRQFGKSLFYPLHSGTFDDLDSLKAYQEIPEVNAVINLKARTFSSGIVKAVNKKGEEIPNHPAAFILNNPNWFQDGFEFRRQTKILREIYGNEYIFKLQPKGFRPTLERMKALYTIPGNLIKLEYREKTPFWVHAEKPQYAEYVLIGGDRIPNENIIHLNEATTDITQAADINCLLGESKLRALKAPINNIRMAYESRGIILKYRGAQGIISPEGKDAAGAVPFDKPDIDILKEVWGNYGTMSGQSQMAIVNVSTKFTPLTLNEPKKLGLFDETRESFYKIMDSFGVKKEMFVQIEGTTYANQREAEKAFYQDTTIPEANEWIQAFNQDWMQDTDDKLIVDFSHLPIFQQDLKIRAEGLEKLVNLLSKALADGAITIDEYKEELKKAGLGKS
jgi:hypothetical protein